MKFSKFGKAAFRFFIFTHFIFSVDGRWIYKSSTVYRLPLVVNRISNEINRNKKRPNNQSGNHRIW